MGFVVSIVYFVVNYLTPPVVFGPLANLRIELILAILLFVISLPKLQGSIILKAPQSLALIGLAFAGSLSVLFGEHWAGGAVRALPDFLPCALAYLLVCLHCNSIKKVKVIVLMLVFICVFVIAQGYSDLLHGASGSGASQAGTSDRAERTLWDLQHPYVMEAGEVEGQALYRIRGLGLINDPNDFAQLIVSVIPLVFIFWRPKRMVLNIAFVILPVGALVFGVHLTESRGGLLALTAVAIMALRRRTGTALALLLAGGVFAAAMALHFTGGREISANSGSDRTVLWGEGLQVLKAHPLFGVGLGNLPEYTDTHHTAHNTVVVCAAELGLVGLYFWSMFLFPTVRDALAVASAPKTDEEEPVIAGAVFAPQATGELEAIDHAEVKRLGGLMVSSLTGFLVAAWFLSRAYVLTFFLLGGLAEVVFEMALQRGMVAPRLRLGRLLAYTGVLEISLVLLMYIMLRVTNLMH